MAITIGKKSFLIALSLALVGLIPAYAQNAQEADLGQGKKIALVIGNADYKNGKLANPVSDAKDMRGKLEDIGFEVSIATDADRKEMYEKLKTFYKKSNDASIALLYYSGHGIESKGENYLIPVKADIKDEGDLESEAVSLTSVVEKSLDAVASGGGNLIVILDACRNNPLGKVRGSSRGLTTVNASSEAGSMIAYSCAPGSTADDGNGRHSPFTEALLRHIDAQDTDFYRIMMTVREEVKEATGGRQIPRLEANSSPLFLNGSANWKEVHGGGLSSSTGAMAFTVVLLVVSMLFFVGAVLALLFLTDKGRKSVSSVYKKVESVSHGALKKADAFIAEKKERFALAKEKHASKNEVQAVVQTESEEVPAFSASTSAQTANTLLKTVQIGRLLVAKTPVTRSEFLGVFGTEVQASENLPATDVTWYDALSFANALSQKENLEPVYDLSDKDNIRMDFTKNGWRLPTQKEWTNFAKRGRGPLLEQVAWYADNAQNVPHDCASKSPDASGLYDVYGLVWEWCSDFAKAGRRILKGGSWDSGMDLCTAKARLEVSPFYKSDNTGFRCVRNAGESK